MKAWHQSKTLWVNAIVAALAALAALEAVTGILPPVLPANFYTIIAVGLPVVNAVLRIVTTQGVALKNNG